MTKETKHIDRNRLIELISEDAIESEPHLTECEECRLAVELLRQFCVAGAVPLPDAPGGWVAKAQAIAASEPLSAKISRLVARIVFDSWASASPVGVRGMETTSDRRIRFETEELSLDLRAEQGTDEWSFIAQLRPATVGSTTLTADGTEIKPNEYGLFEWTTRKPTRHITVLLDDEEIKIPELTWKRPTST
jgi:hypothetical protein